MPTGSTPARKAGRKPSAVSLKRVDAAAHEALEKVIAINYLHTVLAQTCLPYRDPGIETHTWSHQNGSAYLNLTSRKAFDPAIQEWIQVGLPFGAKPRLIMSHLITEALIRQTQTLETDATVTGFAARALGFSPTGRNVRVIKDQMMRLATTSIDIAIMTRPGVAFTRNSKFVDWMEVWAEQDEEKRVVWPTIIHFSDKFFANLQEHAVPLNERHLIGLANSALALDIYTWLAQRLWRVKRGESTLIPWRSLYEQFGHGYSDPYKFRQSFTETLAQVRALYTEAKIELESSGLRLFESKPPVPRNALIGGGKLL